MSSVVSIMSLAECLSLTSSYTQTAKLQLLYFIMFSFMEH